MICSFLLPTRGRFPRLVESIRSLHETASTNHFEVLLGVDNDDEHTLSNLPSLEWYANIRPVIGPRGGGYPEIHKLYSKLAKLAATPWVWIWNDDVTLSGNWVDQLKKVPTTGYIVQPGLHQLGHSIYPDNEGGPFPVVPTCCWEQFGYTEIPAPIDEKLDQILRLNHDWKSWFLKGVKVNHQRDSEEQLETHRK